jgi:pimeloyl-ACP methyl ester carboxylesterase
MFTLLLRAFALWLVLFELLAGLRRWHGLSWLGERFPRGLLLPIALVLHPRGVSWLARTAAMLFTALPAALVQLALGSLRNRTLDPLATLAPGEHPAHTVERFDIVLAEGYTPALLLTPRAGTNAAVCVLHGSGCHKTYFAWRLSDVLLRRGLAVLLIDLDGHGDSPRPQRFPQALEPAFGAVEFLRERFERVGLLGISLGGCIAARAAAEGLAVDAVALLESPPLLEFGVRDQRAEARELVRPFMFDLLGETTPRALGAAVLELVQAQRTPRIAAEISTWELIAALDLLGSLPRIMAPLLLVYGARDAIVKPAQAARAWAAAPHAQFVMAPEASHLTLILHQGTLEKVGEWLTETLNAER